jgi:hypothetical protein
LDPKLHPDGADLSGGHIGLDGAIGPDGTIDMDGIIGPDGDIDMDGDIDPDGAIVSNYSNILFSYSFIQLWRLKYDQNSLHMTAHAVPPWHQEMGH